MSGEGGGGERKIILLQGTQAMFIRPSDKNRVRVKTLGRLVVEACNRDGGILMFSLMNVEIIWKAEHYSGHAARGQFFMNLYSGGCVKSIQ